MLILRWSFESFCLVSMFRWSFESFCLVSMLDSDCVNVGSFGLCSFESFCLCVNVGFRFSDGHLNCVNVGFRFSDGHLNRSVLCQRWIQILRWSFESLSMLDSDSQMVI